MNKISINGRKIEIELNSQYFDKLIEHITEERETFRQTHSHPAKPFEYWYNSRVKDVINDALNRLYADITK